MRLTAIFNEAIKDSDRLVLLYDQLSTSNQRAIRSDWAKSFYDAELTQWPKSAGLWRSKSASMLLVGTDAAGLSHKDFTHDSLSLLLRMALVMAMAAADKVIHEAISKRFAKTIASGKLDEIIKIDLSNAYKVAMAARKHKGKGGHIKPRPASHLKRDLLQKLYRQTFLSAKELSAVCKALDVPNVFEAYGRSQAPIIDSATVKDKWILLYRRRNQIAHECDIVLQHKMRRVHRYNFSAVELRDDVRFAKEVGAYLANVLDT